MAWKLMFAAPKDREIVAYLPNGRVCNASWLDQEGNWRREEVHGWVSEDELVRPILWDEMPTESEIAATY